MWTNRKTKLSNNPLIRNAKQRDWGRAAQDIQYCTLQIRINFSFGQKRRAPGRCWNARGGEQGKITLFNWCNQLHHQSCLSSPGTIHWKFLTFKSWVLGVFLERRMLPWRWQNLFHPDCYPLSRFNLLINNDPKVVVNTPRRYSDSWRNQRRKNKCWN